MIIVIKFSKNMLHSFFIRRNYASNFVNCDNNNIRNTIPQIMAREKNLKTIKAKNC